MTLRKFKNIMSEFHKAKEIDLLLDSGKVISFTSSKTLSSGEVQLLSNNSKTKLTLPKDLDKVVGIQERLIA